MRWGRHSWGVGPGEAQSPGRRDDSGPRAGCGRALCAPGSDAAGRAAGWAAMRRSYRTVEAQWLASPLVACFLPSPLYLPHYPLHESVSDATPWPPELLCHHPVVSSIILLLTRSCHPRPIPAPAPLMSSSSPLWQCCYPSSAPSPVRAARQQRRVVKESGAGLQEPAARHAHTHLDPWGG